MVPLATGPGGSERRRSVIVPSSVMVATPMLSTFSQGTVAPGSTPAAAVTSAKSSATASAARRLQNFITLLHLLRIHIHLLAQRFELLAHLFHPRLGLILRDARLRQGYAGLLRMRIERWVIQPRRIIAHVLRDLHRAEFRPAHGAEVRHLVRLLGQRLVVEFARGFGVEPQVELVLPAEVEARAGERVVAQLRGRVALG